jgi:hypothetical protein
MSIFWRIRLYIRQEFKIKYDQRTEEVTETCRFLFNDDVYQALYSRIVGGHKNDKLRRIRKGAVVATSMYYRGKNRPIFEFYWVIMKRTKGDNNQNARNQGIHRKD